MSSFFLILYSRSGCCLCKSLEEKIRTLDFEEIIPSLEFYSLDIDTSDVSEKDRIRYNLEVPVLFIRSQEEGKLIQLPRASPRMKKDNLRHWLAKVIQEKLEL